MTKKKKDNFLVFTASLKLILSANTDVTKQHMLTVIPLQWVGLTALQCQAKCGS